MSTIYIFGRKRIKELELELKKAQTELKRVQAVSLQTMIQHIEELERLKKQYLFLLEVIKDLESRASKKKQDGVKSRDSKGRFTKKK